jgi:hypothetical protein
MDSLGSVIIKAKQRLGVCQINDRGPSMIFASRGVGAEGKPVSGRWRGWKVVLADFRVAQTCD